MVRENPANEEVIARAGAVEPLVRLLTCDLPEARSYALWSLSLSIDEGNQKIVSESGGIKPLIELLAKQADTEEDAAAARRLEQAARAVRFLAFGSSETQKAIVQHGAVPPLIRLITSPETAASNAGGVGKGSPGGQPAAGASGAAGLRGVTRRNTRASKAEEMLAARAQANGAAAPAPPAPANEDGNPPGLADGASSPSLATASTEAPAVGISPVAVGSALDHATGALSMLAELPANTNPIYVGGGIGPLVAVLSDASSRDETKTFAAATLALLSASVTDDKSRDARKTKEAIAAEEEAKKEEEEAKKKEEALKKKPRRTGASDKGASAAGAKVGSPLAGKGGASSTLLGRSPGLRGAGAAPAVAPEKPTVAATMAEAVAAAGAIPPLVDLLSGDCGASAQQKAAEALWALAGANSNRVAIADAGGIGPLVELLDSPLAAVRKHAEGTLVRLSLEASNQSTIILKLVGMLREAAQDTVATDDGTGEGGSPDSNARRKSRESVELVGGGGARAAATPSDGTGADQAAAVLATLARELPESRNGILEAGGVPLLIELVATSKSIATKEHALSAIAELAHNNPKVQLVIGSEANGIQTLVATIANSSSSVKDDAAAQLWSLAARAIWNLADGNRDNQMRFMKEGAIPPIVGLLSCAHTELRTNAAGAMAVMARGDSKGPNADNQATLIRCGAVTLICATIKEYAGAGGGGTTHEKAVTAQEECAGALWALSMDSSNSTKATIAKAGAIGLLMNQLISLTTEPSARNASGALAALAERNAENTKLISHALVSGLGAQMSKNSRVIRLLGASALLCNNGKAAQDVVSTEPGVFASLVMCLKNTSKDVQVAASQAILALGSQNASTQASIGSNGCVPPLVKLLDIKFVEEGVYDAQRISCCALWHLASLPKNREAIAQAGAIAPLVTMLAESGQLVPRLAAMLLVRLANHSAELVGSIVQLGGIHPTVKLLSSGTPASKQMAAQALAALATVPAHRDTIVDADAIRPLISLLASHELGTPEAAALALANLSRADNDGRGLENDGKGEDGAGGGSGGDAASLMKSLGGGSHKGALWRHSSINSLNGTKWLIAMLSGSNLMPAGQDNLEMAARMTVPGGWPALHVGVAGCHETEEAFTGSNADFGVKMGMQEQAAATLAHMAYGDYSMQDVIVNQLGGVSPLLSLVRSGSPLAQEYAARALWYLSTQLENQKVVVADTAIPDLIGLCKTGTNSAQMLAAATLAELSHGYIQEMHGKQTAAGKRRPRATSGLDAGAYEPGSVLAMQAAGVEIMGQKPLEDRLLAISEHGGIVPLIRIAASGGDMQAKEKAAACLFHLGVDEGNRTFIGANGGITPLANLLSSGSAEAQRYASLAFARIAMDNEENQFFIAKSLVGMLEQVRVNVHDNIQLLLLLLQATISKRTPSTPDTPCSLPTPFSSTPPLRSARAGGSRRAAGGASCA